MMINNQNLITVILITRKNTPAAAYINGLSHIFALNTGRTVGRPSETGLPSILLPEPEMLLLF